MSSESLLEKIILGEIAGKNSAIHAYDGIIWKIRSGFLTIIFAGWGIILKGLIDKDVPLTSVYQYILLMLFISGGIAIGGFVVDLNYVRRKFRVIAALNELMQNLIDCDEARLEEIQFRMEKLLPSLKIAGDAATKKYQISGYTGALTAGVLIYSIPIITLTTVLCFMLLPSN